jgi:hypothetical protein
MQRTGVWLAVVLIGAALASATARGQAEPAPSTGQPSAAASPVPAEPPQGPDWIAPEARGSVPAAAAPTPAPAPAPASQPAAAPPAVPPEPPVAEPQPAQTPPPSAAPAQERPSNARAPDPVFKNWGPPGAGPPPQSGPPIQAALMIGIGGTLNHTAASINPLGLGFGVRGSYRVSPEVVLGGRFLYFVGGSGVLPTGEISMSSWQLAAEAAYVVPIADVVELEPGVLVGMNVLTVHGPKSAFLEGEGTTFVPGSREGTEAALYVAPGAAVRVPLDLAPEIEDFFVGADARFGLQFRHEVGTSIELMGQVGVRF